MVSKFGFLATALVALSSFASAQLSGSGTYTGSRRTPYEVGCFKDSTPLKFANTWEEFQTDGNCQRVCYALKMPVMGLGNGTDCWCGDYYPPKSSQVSNSTCNTPCPGYPEHMCGSGDTWTIYNTGYSLNVIDYYNPPASTSVPSGAASTTSGAETVVKTVEPTSSGTPSSSTDSGGPNTAGIAAGVVVGVVALAAIVGGVWLYLRHRRRREVEEEYKRQAAVSDFVTGGKAMHTSQSSTNDSRLDPDLVMGRRQSNGSIADDQDFSRRILKVTNPDGLY